MRPSTTIRIAVGLIALTLVAAAQGATGMVIGEAREIDAKLMAAPIQIDEEAFTLRLRKYSVRAPGFFVRVYDADGSYSDQTPSPVRTHRGEILNSAGEPRGFGVVSIGLDGCVVAGTVKVDDVRRHLHNGIASELAAVQPMNCRTVETASNDAPMILNRGPVVWRQRRDHRDVFVTAIAIDMDPDFFAHFDSIEEATNYVDFVLAAVNLQFDSQVDIVYELTALVIRSDTAPYHNLPTFVQHWEQSMTDVPRDVAYRFAGEAGGAGAVFQIGSICVETGVSYGYVRYNPHTPRLIGVLEHELGHNWNANHCVCEGTMAANGTQHESAAFDQFSIDEIVPYRDTRPCLDIVQRPVIPRLPTPVAEIFDTSEIDGEVWQYAAGVTLDCDTPEADCRALLAPGAVLHSQSIDTDDVFKVHVSYAWDAAETVPGTLSVEYLSRAYLWVPLATHHAEDGGAVEMIEIGGTSKSPYIAPAHSPDFQLRFTVEGDAAFTLDDVAVDVTRYNPCPEDCSEADGVVDLGDLLQVLLFFQGSGDDPTCDPVPKHPDGSFGNGETNIDDLLAVIYAFGPCDSGDSTD